MNKLDKFVTYWIVSIMTAYIMCFPWFQMQLFFVEVDKEKGRTFLFEGFFLVICGLFMIRYAFSTKLRDELNNLTKNKLGSNIGITLLMIFIWILFAYLAQGYKDYQIFLMITTSFFAFYGSLHLIYVVRNIYVMLKNWYLMDKKVNRKDKNTLLIGCGTLIFALINIFK